MSFPFPVFVPAAGIVLVGTPISIGASLRPFGSTVVTMTTTAAVPAGALVVVATGAGHTGSAINVSTVHDSVNPGAFTFGVASPWNSSSGVLSELWFFPSSLALPSGTTMSVTFTAAPDSFNVGVAMAYVTGVNTLDKTANNAGVTTTATSSGSSGTLTVAREAAFGFVYGDGATTITEGTGFTRLSVQTGGPVTDLAYRLPVATTALNYQPTFGTARDWNNVLATFR